MDAQDFQTIGECELGYTWRVPSEGKIVVNMRNIALYFETNEFFEFAKMIQESAENLSGIDNKEKEEPSEDNKVSNIAQFRPREDN